MDRNKRFIKIADRIATTEEPQSEDFEMADPEQAAIWKTAQILLDKTLYAHGYLNQ
jgi:hypothetical protein